MIAVRRPCASPGETAPYHQLTTEATDSVLKADELPERWSLMNVTIVLVYLIAAGILLAGFYRDVIKGHRH